jgi:hypothetical protein
MLILGGFVNPAGGLSGVISGGDGGWGGPATSCIIALSFRTAYQAIRDAA